MKLTLSGNFIHPHSTNIIVTSRLIDIIKRNKHKHAIAIVIIIVIVTSRIIGIIVIDIITSTPSP